MNDKNGDMPVFDFSRESYKDSRDRQVAATDAIRLGNIIQAMTRGESVPFDQIPTGADMERVYANLDLYLARVLTSVPQDWLVPDAPGELDWHDPTSLDWVRADKINALRDAMNQAAEPEILSGN